MRAKYRDSTQRADTAAPQLTHRRMLLVIKCSKLGEIMKLEF